MNGYPRSRLGESVGAHRLRVLLTLYIDLLQPKDQNLIRMYRDLSGAQLDCRNLSDYALAHIERLYIRHHLLRKP